MHMLFTAAPPVQIVQRTTSGNQKGSPQPPDGLAAIATDYARKGGSDTAISGP